MILQLPSEDLLGLTTTAELIGLVAHPGLRAELRNSLQRMLVIVGAEGVDNLNPADLNPIKDTPRAK